MYVFGTGNLTVPVSSGSRMYFYGIKGDKAFVSFNRIFFQYLLNFNTLSVSHTALLKNDQA